VSTNDEENLRQRAGDAAVIRDAFEAVPTPMAAAEGSGHTIVAANAACRALARQPDLVGKPAWQAFAGFPPQRIADLLDLVYATGEPFSARGWQLLEGHYLDFTLTPWLSPAGVRGVLVTGLEVIDQVQERSVTEPSPIPGDSSRAWRETLAVQEAMLPSELPVLPQVRIAARYLPAGDEPAGGNWFDAFPLLDGQIALMVGDVADRGTAASAAMGRLRSLLRHALTVQPDLAAALGQADRCAASDATLRATTLCIAVLSPADGRFSYATCGHPPPLLVDAAGTTRSLPGTEARPLGTDAVPLTPLAAPADTPSGATFAFRSAVLALGEVLLLYSDGLVKRPGRTLDDGMADLAIVAGDAVANRTLTTWAAGTPAERVGQLAVELLTSTGYVDDVTTLAIWRQPLPLTSLGVEAPAGPDTVNALRRAFSKWLETLGVAFGDRQLAELAIAEVVANAVEHAYQPGRPGPVRLEAVVSPDGHLETRISDRGRWRPPDVSEEVRGQGLSVAAQFAGQLRVIHPPQNASEPHGARGTVVAMRHRLHRQPMLAPLAVRPSGTRVVQPEFAVEVAAAEPAPHVRVSGPVDFTTADQLASRLLAASRAGVLPLTVDLSAVTILAIAGVRVLYETATQLAAHGQELTLISKPRSPAADVLDLARLPRSPRQAP